MTTVLGIDPGLSGALALVSHPKSILIDVIDMPVCPRSKEVDGYKIAEWLEFRRIDFAVMEDVGVMTGNEGRVSMFNFGVSAGIVRGVLQARDVPIKYVKPAVWKQLLGLSSDKNKSRELAMKAFPKDSHRFTRKKDDGRAEAALLARFGAERLRF